MGHLGVLSQNLLSREGSMGAGRHGYRMGGGVQARSIVPPPPHLTALSLSHTYACAHIQTHAHVFMHAHTQAADFINEMGPVTTATGMNEHRKVTVETVNGKWPVAMETL